MDIGGNGMGLGAGGRTKQEISPDRHRLETWDEANCGRVYIYIVKSMMYRELTGKEAPSTPVSAREYAESGLPWFDLYDEGKGDTAPAGEFSGIKSVKAMDQDKGFAVQQDDESIGDVPVMNLHHGSEHVADGVW